MLSALLVVSCLIPVPLAFIMKIPVALVPTTTTFAGGVAMAVSVP